MGSAAVRRQVEAAPVTPAGLPRVLCISVDRALADAQPARLGDSRHHAIRLGRATAELHIVVYSAESSPPMQLAPNVWVYATGSSSKAAFFADAYRIGSRLCRERQIEVVYTQDLYATAMVGYALKKRFSLGLCALIAGDMLGNRYWLAEDWLNRLWNRVGHVLVQRCDSIRVASSTEREKLMRLGVPGEQIFMIGWFIELTKFLEADGMALRESLLEGTAATEIVLSVGRLVAQKDYPTLFHAMRRVVEVRPQTLLVIAGAGGEREKLQQLIRELGIDPQVRLLGAVPHDDVARYMAAADVFALSSVYEGNARVLAEASAAALPIVATETSGTRDTVLDGSSGHIVRQKDIASLADRLLDLLVDERGRRRMGLRGREHVLRMFGDQTLLDAFREMFRFAARGGEGQ